MGRSVCDGREDGGGWGRVGTRIVVLFDDFGGRLCGVFLVVDSLCKSCSVGA